jgi:hypothetical protein
MRNANYLVLFSLAVALISPCSAQAQTTTSLNVLYQGAPTTAVEAGSTVALTATVVAPLFTQVVQGQVMFCDAAAAHCTDLHLLGTAQLNSSGTAVVSLTPAIGTHSYKAVFVANGANQGSSSSTVQLTVMGDYATTTSIADAGVPGNYFVTAAVASAGGTAPLSGEVTFVDTSNSDASLGSVSLTGKPGVLTWSNPQTILTPDYPIGVVAADFNGDGRLDLAWANLTNHTVNMSLGDDNGTFTQKFTIGLTEPTAIAVGDFNGDGILDMAVNNYGTGGGAILQGNGDGTFGLVSVPFATGDSPNSIVAADLNGDGIEDLAVLNECGSDNCATSTSPGTVSILIGNGNGTFTLKTESPSVGNLPQSMAMADFNGDGIPDLAVANFGGGSGNSVSVLIGNGDGTFTAKPLIPTAGQGFPNLTVGDFTGNGHEDIAITTETEDDVSTLTILLGNGDGTFTQTPTSPTTGLLPGNVAAGDFNGDGVLDLAVSNELDNTVSVFLGKGDGTFTPIAPLLATDTQPASIAAGDFNGDGFSDLAVAAYLGDTIAVLSPELTYSTAATLSVAPAVNTGTHRVEARYFGDTSHASSVSGLVTLKSQTTPTITWVAPAPIVNPAPLSATQLDATASVAGTFVYSPALGTVLAPGSHTLSVAFTPTDKADFTTASATVTLQVNQAAALTSPAPSSTLAGPSVTFTWSAGMGATAYQLWLGSTGVDSNNLYSSGVTTATSVARTNLPTNGETIYARLFTEFGSTWTSVNYTLTAAAQAAPVSPAIGATLSGPSQTFTWTAGTGANDDAYQFWLGSTGVGSNNVYSSGVIHTTSLTRTNMPVNGETIYARLYTDYDGTWVHQDYTLTAAAEAVLTSPAPSSTLSGASVKFTWSAATGGATQYQFWLGSTGVGSNNLYSSGVITSTTVTRTNLPTNGEIINARLYTNFNGTWTHIDYTYKAAP